MEKPILVFTDSISTTLKSYCSENSISNAIILCDSNTKRHCLPLLGVTGFKTIVIEAGENSKNLSGFEKIINELIALGAGRETRLINLGGGMISDIGGFAASVYKRGIPFINIPTTLLAMTDAAHGGKTGIDHAGLKNYIGSFTNPEAVFVSEEFLLTLPEDEIKSAWAEIIKIAAIASEPLFEMIENNAGRSDIIKKAARLKLDIVFGDFRDDGKRQLLNFGHTIGHAYESFKLNKGHPVLHGYAVACGMLLELKIAVKLGLLKLSECSRIEKQLMSYVNPAEIIDSEFDSLFEYLAADKKNKGNELTFSLPLKTGEGRFGIKLEAGHLKNWKNKGFI